MTAPRCEVCRQEPAISFSWFPDRARWYEAASGTWRFTGPCTADDEHYYVLFHDRARQGYLDSAAARADWLEHLADKDWFSWGDFVAMLVRFEVARETRLCFVCTGPVANGDGCWQSDLRIVVHGGTCAERVGAERRDYSRSAKGRARPRHEVLARLRQAAGEYRAAELLAELDALERRP